MVDPSDNSTTTSIPDGYAPGVICEYPTTTTTSTTTLPTPPPFDQDTPNTANYHNHNMKFAAGTVDNEDNSHKLNKKKSLAGKGLNASLLKMEKIRSIMQIFKKYVY
ncbi:hypothetical protein FOZ60_012863, partial [Perkinsus olseni]